jgi:hypothetical protein
MIMLKSYSKVQKYDDISITECDMIMERGRVLLLLAFSPVIFSIKE